MNGARDPILIRSSSGFPLPKPSECETMDEDPVTPSQYEVIMSEIDRLRAEIEKISETSQKEDDEVSSERPDPAEDSAIWNLNSISVLTWKSLFWPTGKQWNHEKEQFEKHQSFSNTQIRSRSQHWLESNLCPLLFTLFPMLVVFIEMCILSGIMDQGSNVKTRIYGDGYYQSPAWRYSSAAYLRARFVPLLDSKGVQIGMTSSTDSFNHSMLKDRPSGEAEHCLDDAYLMSFNRYQASPSYQQHMQHELLNMCAQANLEHEDIDVGNAIAPLDTVLLRHLSYFPSPTPSHVAARQ